jgi:hypothetical protein
MEYEKKAKAFATEWWLLAETVKEVEMVYFTGQTALLLSGMKLEKEAG